MAIGDNEHLAWEELNKETRTIIRVLVDEIKGVHDLGSILEKVGEVIQTEPLFVAEHIQWWAEGQNITLNIRIQRALARLADAEQEVKNTADPDIEPEPDEPV